MPHRQVAAAQQAAGAGVGLAQLVAQCCQLGLLRRQQRLQLRRFALRVSSHHLSSFAHMASIINHLSTKKCSLLQWKRPSPVAHGWGCVKHNFMSTSCMADMSMCYDPKATGPYT